MTLPSWKSLPITRWSIHLPNRHNLPVRAALIAFTAWFAPIGWAEDAIAPKPATPLEVLRQQNAAQRWERVKTLTPQVEQSAEPRISKSRPGVVLPLPDDEEIAIGRAELKLAPLLPDSPEEPRWVLPARPVPEPLEEPAATAVEISAQSVTPEVIRIPQTTASIPPASSSTEGSVLATSVTAAIDSKVIAQAPAETSTLPAMKTPPGARKLRSISEISPYYDTTVDKDIREFALQRAADYDVAFGTQTFQPRAFPDTMYAWEASNFYHYPLYFEDAVLERYGHTYHPLVQPVVSVAKFGGQLVMLPYQMTLDPINRPMYALGWYRPGDCAPKLRYQPPLNAKAAAVEAGVWTGLFFLVP